MLCSCLWEAGLWLEAGRSHGWESECKESCFVVTLRLLRHSFSYIPVDMGSSSHTAFSDSRRTVIVVMEVTRLFSQTTAIFTIPNCDGLVMDATL